MNKDVHFWACLRLICARASYLSCLFSKKLTVKGFSEPTRTSVVPYRSEFCIKLVFSRHTRKYVGKKCTRMYTSGQAIFKKANGERLFRTDKDVGGSIQKRVCLQTRSPRMYTDVHSWARYLRRHTAKKCPQRIKDTPAVLFYRIPCICIVYFKRLTEKLCSEAARMPLVLRSNKFALQTCSPKIYTDVYFGRGCPWL